MLLGTDELTILRGSKFYGTWQWVNSVTGNPEDFAGLTASIKIKNIHEDFVDSKNTYEVGTATVEPLDVDTNVFKGRVDISLSKEDTLLFAIPEVEEDKYGESDFYGILEILLSTGEVILQAKVKVVESLESETLNFLLNEKDEAIIINAKLDNILLRHNEYISTRDNLINVVIPTAINTYTEKLELYNQNHTQKVQTLEEIATIVNQDKSDVESMKQNVQDNKDSVKTYAEQASQSASNAKDSEKIAKQKADLILNLEVQIETLSNSQTATIDYNAESGVLSLGIPQGGKGNSFTYDDFTAEQIEALKGADGDKGDKGDAFTYGDFTPEQLLLLEGPKGADGDKGDKGDAFTYGDFTPEQLLLLEGPKGADGADGLSAYQVALNNDFVGTEQEWLESLNANLIESNIPSLPISKIINLESTLNSKINIADVIDSLNSIETNKPLSANQGKILKDLIDNINTLLSSDDTTLDELQEIINFIKQNKSTLDALGISNIAGLQLALDAKANIADVYTKTSLDLKISTQQFDKPTRGPLFVKVSPSSIKIPAGLKLTVGTESFKVITDYTLTLASNLVGSTKTAGTDYFVYAKSDATFYISADDTITSDRLIGGFHYGLVGETETVTGNKTEAMMVEQRGIWSHSCWDLKFRPSANVRAKNFAHGIWTDIYLADEDIATRGYSSPWKSVGVKAKIAGGTTDYGRAIPKIPLAFGGNGTLTYGKFTWFQAAEIAASLKCFLLDYGKFPSLAYGVLEGVSSSTNGYETTAGAIEHYPNLTSRYLEQAIGVQCIWGANLANYPTDGTWAWRANTDSRGQIYSTENSPAAVVLGGSRGDGVNAGSRSSGWGDYIWASRWYIGCRFACDHLELV